MSWFSFWGGNQESDTTNLESTLASTESIRKANAGFVATKAVFGAVEGLAGLQNIDLYKKERDNEIKAIENQMLAGQEQVIRELSYNTDQTLTYAARGNVSIGAPVINARMRKGAEEAGFDMAMLKTNADIGKINAKIKYSQKRKESFDRAMQGVWNAMLTVGVYNNTYGNSEGGSLNRIVYGG